MIRKPERTKKRLTPAQPHRERVVEAMCLKARMAVVENDGENGEAAQSLQFGDVGRQPGWALDGKVAG